MLEAGVGLRKTSVKLSTTQLDQFGFKLFYIQDLNITMRAGMGSFFTPHFIVNS